MFHLDEYSIKKHLFQVFVGLMGGAIVFIYFQGERILYVNFFPEERGMEQGAYHNDEYAFSVNHPAAYAVREEMEENSLQVFFVREYTPAIENAPLIFAGSIDRSTYLESMKKRQNTRILSERNVTVGNGIFAKQIISSFTRTAGGEKLKETIFSQNGKLYVIGQLYEKNPDAIYNVLLQSFKFK
jgi:hypothetical protein